ncbi:MAG: TonB family protein [Acidobacteria bacterium]|nr:TonB family protein [Acidobacteriota bacterium]MBI3278332.1 TonB family protein [Acidobacteriota bacterium]
MNWTQSVSATVINSAVLLGAALLASALLRRRSAAWRHLVWISALIGSVLLPLLSTVASRLEVTRYVAQAPADVVARTARTYIVVDGSKPMPDLAAALPWMWAMVAGALLLRWLAAWARVRWIAGRARRLDHPVAEVCAAEAGLRRAVPVLISRDISVPAAFGIFRPGVLLPAGAAEWTADRLRIVLLHELAHIARADVLSLALARIAGALYWFHPLVWLAVRRVHAESELAADDLVVRATAEPAGYASHLLEIARGARSSGHLAGALAMARPSQLEGRLMAILDNSRNRQPLTRAAMAITILAVASLLMPLAAMQSGGVLASGLAGTVRDVVGVVPGADVIAVHKESGSEYRAISDSVGNYALPGLPGGTYTIEVRKPGFRLLKVGGIQLSASKGLKLDHYLELGRLQETINVSAEGTPRAVAAAADPKIRVSGNVQAAKLRKMARPAYPPAAKEQGIEGSVIMRAVVSKEGKVVNLQVLSSSDPELARAAMEAVQQWEYMPTLLNGDPVEIVTDVVVNFSLAR